MDESGRPRLADFGLSRVVDSQASLVSANSQKGRTSVRWQAPELLDPASFKEETGNVSTRSDVYSLACVFIEVSLTTTVNIVLSPIFSDIYR